MDVLGALFRCFFRIDRIDFWDDPGIFQDIDTINAVFKELTMPRVVVLLLPKMRATSNLLGRVLNLHMSEYSPRYNDMIPVEAAAMRPTVVEALRWAC
jgi:hypothetical protein